MSTARPAMMTWRSLSSGPTALEWLLNIARVCNGVRSTVKKRGNQYVDSRNNPRRTTSVITAAVSDGSRNSSQGCTLSGDER